MHVKSIPKLLKTNLHFIWVILFFIVHGYAQAYQLVPLNELLFLSLQIGLGGIMVFLLSTKLLGNKAKGGIFTSVILVIILFFGAFQDFFADTRWLSILSYLRPLILICVVITVMIFFFLKKTRVSFTKTTVYINSLFLLYLIIDIITILFLSSSVSTLNANTVTKFNSRGCDTCKLPSVYLVVMDEYLGTEGLKEYFHYSNVPFENFLRSRDFTVLRDTKSNYQFTLFSIASMLNMRFLEEIKEKEMHDRFVYNKVLSLLKNNIVCNIFQRNGYRIINLSGFEIKNAPSEILSTELPQRVELITAQTMIYRIGKYLPVWLEDWKLVAHSKKDDLTIADVNEVAMERALTVARDEDSQPVFAYVHLMMPHSPFIYDSLGRRTGFIGENLPGAETDDAYLQYLVYTNRRVGRFIQELQRETEHQSVIALMSDHGYRTAGRNGIKHSYQTFNALFLPNKNYAGWYDGITNVNQFRMLLNSVFGQALPLLKDSIVHQSGKDSRAINY